MSDQPLPPGGAGFDLDADLNDAWVDFRDDLAVHLDAMAPGDVAVFGVLVTTVDETGPYVQFAVDQNDVLRCEVSSNEYLGPSHQLDDDQQRALVDDGWCMPGIGEHDQNFHLDVDERDPTRLADMATTALRDVLGVIHPSFLDLSMWGAEPELIDEDEDDDEMVDDVDAEEELAELRDEVEAALADVAGERVSRDEDDDIRVQLPDRHVFVRVHDMYMIGVYTPVTIEVSGRTRAAEVLGDLNNKHRFVKWLLVDDSVIASVQIPCKPFVAEHVLGMITVLHSLGEFAESLAETLGGRLPPGQIA